MDYSSLYAQLSPSVVTIRTLSRSDMATGRLSGSGVGSGFMIEPDLVMTAAHVVQDARLIRVVFKDGLQLSAQVIASIESTDAALLRLDKAHPNPVTVTMGSSESVTVGEPVFVIGAPYGIGHTLSVGHLSGKLSRSLIAGGAPVKLLQTDSAINPGNSGGPMFNQHGEAIGIVSFILSNSGGFNGIGFATSVETAHDALFNSSGFWAGFEGVLLDDNQAAALNLPAPGILVQRVVNGSVADQSGLKAGTLPARLGEHDMLLGGDVILEINGLVCADPHDFRELSEAARRLRPDQGYQMRVFRRGELLSLTALAKDPQVFMD
ncbi:MAG: trypsin-like serine protease [Granulosicoccus sp.]|nr:trypsin-like serine protease [Granulosicoccus sp.]